MFFNYYFLRISATIACCLFIKTKYDSYDYFPFAINRYKQWLPGRKIYWRSILPLVFSWRWLGERACQQGNHSIQTTYLHTPQVRKQSFSWKWKDFSDNIFFKFGVSWVDIPTKWLWKQLEVNTFFSWLRLLIEEFPLIFFIIFNKYYF